ncbi:MAG: hypothetical protein Q7R75_01100 [bacterium]|nr:hypothetical protein [bacterium]
MKKNALAILLVAICATASSCVINIDCMCKKFIETEKTKKSPPVPEVKKTAPQHPAFETPNKLISHFLVLNNKAVMEFRTAKSAVLFNEHNVIGLLAEEKGSTCAVHVIKIYDFDQDGRLDLFELDEKLFQWSVTDKNKLYLPEFGYLEKDALDLMKYANEIFDQYRLIFKKGGGILQKEGVYVKDVHDLYVEKYWEFYAKGCSTKISQPTLSELSLFDPRK